MIAKTIFLVLLGAALVMGYPKVQETVKIESKTVDRALVERSIEDIWNKISNKFSQAVDDIKTAWNKIKAEGKEILGKINLKAIKDKGLELLEKAKELTKEIVLEGKEVAPEVTKVKNSLEELVTELKKDGSDALSEGKKLVEEVVKEVKEKLVDIDQEVKETVKDSGKVDVSAKVEVKKN